MDNVARRSPSTPPGGSRNPPWSFFFAACAGGRRRPTRRVDVTKGALAPIAQPQPRSFQCNWGKKGQAYFSVSIRPHFQVGKSHHKTWQNGEGKLIGPWVELEKNQYELLKRLQENTGRPVSGMVREAASRFLTRKDYSSSIGASHLPRGRREDYRRVTAYFRRSDLSLLVRIPKETGRCRTRLIREAVDKYLGGAP